MLREPDFSALVRRFSLLGLCLVALAGCTRTHYRLQADAEAYSLVDSRYTDPRWILDQYTIEIDPRSRYFDPYDPDEPPMPPDDPASHTYMHCVDGMKGWKKWHDFGDRMELENPSWREGLGELAMINDQGEIVLDLNSALDIAYVHSPNYQDQVETLYLSALDVSTERFRLDTQFFGGVDHEYLTTGDKAPGSNIVNGNLERNQFTQRGSGATATNLRAARPVGVQIPNSLAAGRRFATAGELLVGFANSFVWEFTGGDSNFTTSFLNFSLVQPLLRGAGRDIALEQLTIVERGLLANVRALTRYRRGFYTNVAIGNLGVAGPSRRGGFFGGTGLTGFTGQGAGGLGGVGAATGFGRGGFGGVGGAGAGGGAGFAGGGAGTVGGFIGLLQQLQQIRNTEDSLALQIRTLNLLEAYLDAGVIDLVQVDQFRQNIETERALLLQARNQLTNSQETFKTGTLGLPPDLPMTLDDSLIQQFQFVDPLATDLQNRIGDLQDELGSMPDDADSDVLLDMLDTASTLAATGSAQFDRIAIDLDRMEDGAPVREASMEEEERSLFTRERQQLHDSLTELRTELADLTPQLDTMRMLVQDGNQDEAISSFVIWINDLYRLIQVSSLTQARARLEAIVIEPVDLAPADAFQIALENRLDIMNNRAALVDSWRLIAFNADALQANLDVVFNGNMATSRNNPMSFDGSTGDLRVGLQFDAPFTRLLERNNFRQSLIDYQSDRRSFIRQLDGVNQTLRTLLRDLNQLELNLEIQRRAVAISIRRVDLTREELNEPVPPPEPGQPAAQFGPTAAQNLLTALSDLRNTQDNFMSVWLNHYATRMVLMRDLGIMILDEEGGWVDESIPAGSMPYYEGEEFLPPPPVPAEFFEVVSLTNTAPERGAPVVTAAATMVH